MLFKIYKSEFERLADFFKKKDDMFATIEMEPMMTTVSELQMRQAMEEEAYKRGHRKGYEEAWFDFRRNRNYYLGYDPSSKDGDKSCIVIAEKEKDGSIKIIKEI